METIDIKEAASLLRCGVTEAYLLAESGILPGAKIGKSWVFRKVALDKFLEKETERQMSERRQKHQAQNLKLVTPEVTSKLQKQVLMLPDTKPTKRGLRKLSMKDLEDYVKVG